MFKKPDIERIWTWLYSLHPSRSQIIKALHMKTRSVPERIFMRQSGESEYEADPISLDESFLIRLRTQRKSIENIKVNIYIQLSREYKVRYLQSKNKEYLRKNMYSFKPIIKINHTPNENKINCSIIALILNQYKLAFKSPK